MTNVQIEALMDFARTSAISWMKQQEGPRSEEVLDEAARRGVKYAGLLHGTALGDREQAAAASRLAAALKAEFDIEISAASALESSEEDFAPWLAGTRGGVEWDRWRRYRAYLEDRLPARVVNRLDENSDLVLDLCGDPRLPSLDRRGLVVGMVQSGKTSNYVGLANKAFDAGYKAVIVLTGFTENLRHQTQARFDDGCLGYEQEWNRADKKVDYRTIGVGEGRQVKQLASWTRSATARKADFSKQSASHFLPDHERPTLFVVKKNVSPLKNLLALFEEIGGLVEGDRGTHVAVRDFPAMIIDDESDVGSIDTRKGAVIEGGEVDEEHNPTRINLLIRQLVSAFPRVAYVGYTATPFANVLIHDEAKAGVQPLGGVAASRGPGFLVGEDLFPRSFIVSLEPPDNHVGPAVVFGAGDRKALPILRDVEGSAGWLPEGHKVGTIPGPAVPSSLRRAIQSFFLSCAVRTLRGGGGKHMSMLVHVTRFTGTQDRVRDQVADEVREMRDTLEAGMGKKALIREFRELWSEKEDGFEAVTRKIRGLGESPLFQNQLPEWSEVEEVLLKSIHRIEVTAIHGKSGSELEYDRRPDGLHVIAVGGDKLSRGLTLEGLSVSYFLRCSKMYDTLMQMGRWFGYRDGYLDLCRLYTSDSLSKWFKHIAEANEELREEFRHMRDQGKTPRDFGLKVRSHPEMLVTSAAKARFGEKRQVTFAGTTRQTRRFDKGYGKKNIDVAGELVKACIAHGVETPPELRRGTDGWADVPASVVLRFLESYEYSESGEAELERMNFDLYQKFIKKENDAGRLVRWRVSIAGLERLSEDPAERLELGGVEISPRSRSWDEDLRSTGRHEALGKAGTFATKALGDPKHELEGFAGPGDPNWESAVANCKEHYRSKGDPLKGEVPEASKLVRFIKQVRDPEEGLLVLYPIRTSELGDTPVDLLGFLLHSPMAREGGASKVEYVVNAVYQAEEDF
ncbi:Z1 domain-containing protein [bacterium]|nr:Z1 domain-containing protein [bacterium]